MHLFSKSIYSGLALNQRLQNFAGANSGSECLPVLHVQYLHHFDATITVVAVMVILTVTISGIILSRLHFTDFLLQLHSTTTFCCILWMREYAVTKTHVFVFEIEEILCRIASTNKCQLQKCRNAELWENLFLPQQMQIQSRQRLSKIIGKGWME